MLGRSPLAYWVLGGAAVVGGCIAVDPPGSSGTGAASAGAVTSTATGGVACPAGDAGGACDDGNPCTVDTCDTTTGLCAHAPGAPGQSCGQKLVCTGDGRCLPPGTLLWSRRWGGSGDTALTSVAVDPDGNVYLAGTFDGTLDLGGLFPLTTLVPAAFFAKLDPSGNVVWGHPLPCAHDLQLAAGSGGVVAMTGNADDCSGPLHIEPTDTSFLVTIETQAGGVGWTDGFGGAAVPSALVVNATGETVVAGTFRGSATFDPLAPLTTTQSAGALFVAAFDGSGKLAWNIAADDASASAVAMDDTGGARVGGTFGDALTLDGASVAGPGPAAFLVAFDPHGAVSWGNGLPSCSIAGVALDGTHGTTLAGTCFGPVDFGSGPQGNAGVENAFLARFDEAGTVGFSRVFAGGGASATSALHLAADSAGDLALMAQLDGDATFGGDVLQNPRIDADAGGGVGPAGLVLASFGADGTPHWSKNYGTSGTWTATGVGFDAGGDGYFAGTFAGSIDFGDGALVSVGTHDLFVAKFGP